MLPESVQNFIAAEVAANWAQAAIASLVSGANA